MASGEIEPKRERQDPLERFWSMVNKDGPILRPMTTPCWEWTGPISHGPRHGYGLFFDLGRKTPAHIYAYDLQAQTTHAERYAAGIVLDHGCSNRLCVRPDHLEEIPGAVNTLRGSGPSARNAMKTHCDNGHKLTGSVMDRGHLRRYCKICKSERQKAYRLKAREAKVNI